MTSRTMRFMAPPTRAHRLVRNLILRGSVHSRALRRRVDSGKLAEPARYAGEGPVGTLCPPKAVRGEAGRGFATASLGGRTYLVRPDGYVAAPLGDEGPGRALEAVLGTR